MKRKVLIGAVLVIILGIVIFAISKRRGNGIEFRMEKITKGEIEATVTATGTVNAVTSVLVGTQVSGRIKNIYVDFNAPVEKGQLIAQIDPETYDAQLEQAKANLLSAKANVKRQRLPSLMPEEPWIGGASSLKKEWFPRVTSM